MLKRIGFYITSYSGGGAEREMIYLANEFADRGYQVDLIVHRDAGPLKDLVGQSVNQIVIDRNYFYDVVVLVRYIRKEMPWFISSTLHVPNWCLAIAKLIARGRTKIFWRVVISLTHTKRSGRGIVYRLLPILYPLLSRVADATICVSGGVAEDAMEHFGVPRKKCRIMHNPAYHGDIHSLGDEPVDHRWMSGDKEEKVVVALGRLSPQKDFETLIKAISKVAETEKNVRLIILGDGTLKDSLQDLIDDLALSQFIELLGFEVNPYKYLAKADLCVLSSRFEGFGNVIVEALALNVPVVSTDCPFGPSEILENEKWGRLVPVGDFEKMAEVIIEVLTNKTHLETLDRAKDFSVAEVANGYLNLANKGLLGMEKNNV